MLEASAFQSLLRRVRAGDPEGAAELVRLYEPEIRRAIRVRLTDPRLHRVLDSVDVCQSVLATFFAHVASGRFELDQPEQLLGLLITMAQNSLRDQVRKQQAAKRDVRRIQSDGGEALEMTVASTPTPSRIVEGRELLEEVYQKLPEEERYWAEQHALGRTWADLAGEARASAEALRKRVTRAIDRVAAELGL